MFIKTFKIDEQKEKMTMTIITKKKDVGKEDGIYSHVLVEKNVDAY